MSASHLTAGPLTTGPGHIAIIGCGFSGTSALFQLVDGYPVRKITVFEASGTFGPGYPYRREDCPDYLVNNTTDDMCLAPGNRRAFIAWLRRQPQWGPDIPPKGHLPRAAYGAFLEDVVRASLTAAAIKGIEVTLVSHEVTGLSEAADGTVRVTWPKGSITADAALLTTGRCPDLPPPAPLAGQAGYIANHIMDQALDHVPLDQTVHILGASLSAYDVVNRLFAPSTGCRFARDAEGWPRFIPGGNRRRVVLCSRSGRLKAVASQAPGQIQRRHFTLAALRDLAKDGPLTIETVAALIRKEAEAHGAPIDWDRLRDPYRGCQDRPAVDRRAAEILTDAIGAAQRGGAENFLVDFFGDAQVDIWDAFADGLLSPESEQRYRKRWETATLCYAAPCPVPTAEKLLALIRAGRLSVIKGLEQVSAAPDGDGFILRHDLGEERARLLVDTTGRVNREVTSPGQPPLIADLVRQDLLAPYDRLGTAGKGAALDMASFRATGARNIYLANMLLWGPGFFTSSAFMMAEVVRRILEGLYGPPPSEGPA